MHLPRNASICPLWLDTSKMISEISEIIRYDVPFHYFDGFLEPSHPKIGKDPIDQSLLLKFFQSVRYLDSLTIHEACSLDQSFFDRLPVLVLTDCISIENLWIDFSSDYPHDNRERGLIAIRDHQFLKRLACRDIHYRV